jgi:hypothetical protein
MVDVSAIMKVKSSRKIWSFNWSTRSSFLIVSYASASFPFTKASRASRSISLAISAILGMSISGFTGGTVRRNSARSVMLIAWSPIRSMSVLIFMAAVMNRRSAAVGCRRAIISRQISSMSMWSWLTCASIAVTSGSISIFRSTSAWMARWVICSTSPPIRRTVSRRLPSSSR